jgi:hypothetical protein
MRISSMLALLALGSCLAIVGPRTTSAASATRHDGTVEAVDVATGRLVIREYGARARAFDFPVHVSADARIVVSQRNERASDVQHAFIETPVRLADIKPGDFVLVDVTGRGAHARAHSVVVTRRGGK